MKEKHLLIKPGYKEAATMVIGQEHNQTKIADTCGVSQMTVSRISNMPAIRAIIDKITLDSINNLAPMIYDNRARRIKLANEGMKYLEDPSNNSLKNEGLELADIMKLQEIAQKDEKQIDQNTGMAPTHTLPIAIQNLNIFNDNRQVLSDTVATALARSSMDDTSIPADVTMSQDAPE